jgi:pyridoxal phosphate enzyme (YggS family)
MIPEAETAGGSAQRLAEAQAKIAAAAQAVGRDPAEVRLIAVSKTFDAPEILPVLQAGHRQFGENRVQEAKGKWPGLKTQFLDLKLHLVGPLQSNKAKEAVELFDAIHSIDRPKIARAIAEEMKKQGKRLELLVQVNTGEEPQKAGVVPAALPAFLALCRNELGLEVAGLMCIPPIDEEPAIHFAFLEKLAAENGCASLSMGMSDDYETAVQFGATYVRVGSAIFGSRSNP